MTDWLENYALEMAHAHPQPLEEEPKAMAQIDFLIGYIEAIVISHDCRNASLDRYRVPLEISNWIGDALKDSYPEVAAAWLECGVARSGDPNRESCREILPDIRDRALASLKELAYA